MELSAVSLLEESSSASGDAACPGRSRRAEGAHCTDPPEARVSAPPRSSRVPGTGFGHELLLALIMAIAMTATVLLYR
jgi:hypothetical protein